MEDEEIYFGDKSCFLYPCTGIFRSYKKEYIQQDEVNEESISETLKYAEDLSYIKPEYKDYYLPALPSIQIHFNNNNLKEDETEDNNLFLKQPLIKSKEIKNYPLNYKCIASGHRSALIKDPKTGFYYRLKGCGNDELGFNLQKSKRSFPQYNTRGSQFDCTCFRELYFTEKVSEAMKKINIPCANIPIGFWKYSKELNIIPDEKVKMEDIPILENQVPEIDKYCAVFQTLGERRLRTHLLCGIDIIFENIAKLCVSKNILNEEILNEIKKIFSESRLPDRFKTYFQVNNSMCPTEIKFEDWCKKPIYDEKCYEAIISCKKLKKEIEENKNLKIFSEQAEKYDELYPFLTEDLSEKHQKMVRKILDNLIQGQKEGKIFFKTLLDIYARIGYEAGKIKRCLQDANINWGTYIDRQVDYHCNAHSNNLVILPQGNDSLLAPLDFDLSYSKDKMVLLSKDTESFGKQDDSYWYNYIQCEQGNLALNLCGADDYNSENEKKRFKQDTFEAKVRNVMKYLFSDCLLENYMKGFDNIISDDVINSNQLKEDSFLHNIIKLALVLTLNDVA